MGNGQDVIYPHWLTKLFQRFGQTPKPDALPDRLKVKAPVYFIERRPYAILLSGGPENTCLPLSSEVLSADYEDHRVYPLTVALLDPRFRPDTFPLDASFALEERFCPNVQTLRPGDWVCAEFRQTKEGLVSSHFEVINAHNVVTLNLRHT